MANTRGIFESLEMLTLNNKSEEIKPDSDETKAEIESTKIQGPMKLQLSKSLEIPIDKKKTIDQNEEKITSQSYKDSVSFLNMIGSPPEVSQLKKKQWLRYSNEAPPPQAKEQENIIKRTNSLKN